MGARREEAPGVPGLLIIADDLSGAADCAVGYASRGLSTSIRLAPGGGTGCQVLAMDADSRHLTPEAAARACLEAWQAVEGRPQWLYKKIDSTLRGNFVSEVAALVALAGMALVAPALPAMGRATREGRQYLDGVPVERTEAWRHDRLTGQADLCAMLSQGGVETRLLPLEALRNWEEARLVEWCRTQQDEGVGAIVCDSETDRDLRRVARIGAGLREVFWVGSAGLAHQLFGVLALAAEASAPKADRVAVSGPILTVVGSMSQVSRRQVEALKNMSAPAIVSCEVDLRQLMAGGEGEFRLPDVEQALDAGKDVLVALGSNEPIPGLDGRALCRRLASCLGDRLARLGGLVATGGETARALLDAGQLADLDVVGEVEPGVVLSVAECLRLPVVTKAGGFGRPETLCNAWRYLDRQRHSPVVASSRHG
ncbi:four-carbon acid sugar kinase family protein [Halomonas sp. A29]|uniref:four-carbon acid sugar kinase family protein n=1 Tax=Halomonas sp. A29 TaxID=3102786 RepID=UPI00398A78A8